MDFELKYGSPLLMGSGTILADECKKEGRQEEMKCLVCGGDMAHFNLGAKICRACASFYRRSITEKLRYICQSDGHCNVEITLLRSKCKACRFEKCKQVGLTEAALNSRRSCAVKRSLSESPPSCSFSPIYHAKVSTSKLNELVKGYDNFLDSQRSLFVIAHPDLAFSDKYVMPKMTGLAKMQQDSIPLLFQMFNQHYGPFTKLPSKYKVKIISEAYHDISNFHHAYLTSTVFPELDDDRVAVTNGYFLKMDLNLLPEFMDGYMGSDKVQELAKAAMAIIVNKILKNCRRFKFLKIRKEDSIMLWFLAILKHAERLELLNDEIIQYKEALMIEWVNDLGRTYGVQEGGTQLARMMTFNIESDDLGEKMTNIQIISKVKWPEEKNGEIDEFMKELSLNENNL